MAKSQALRRLMQDLKETQKERLDTVTCLPVGEDFFCWHANLRPKFGPYAGVIFHLKLQFPDTYPLEPPGVTICTEVRHPNVVGDKVCLDMLSTENAQAYQGWTSAYSVQSILLQLQSFLFDEYILQDDLKGGDLKKALLDLASVKSTTHAAKTFTCAECGHSFSNPFPDFLSRPQDEIEICPIQLSETDKHPSCELRMGGKACQVNDSEWAGVRATDGVLVEKGRGGFMFECKINWFGGTWSRNNIGGGLVRVGWSTSKAGLKLGQDRYGYGYGGTGKKSHDNRFQDFGEPFGGGDVIGCYVHCDHGTMYFARNGRLMSGVLHYSPDADPDEVAVSDCAFRIDTRFYGEKLIPALWLKNAQAEMNFLQPRFVVPGFEHYKPIGVALSEPPPPPPMPEAPPPEAIAEEQTEPVAPSESELSNSSPVVVASEPELMPPPAPRQAEQQPQQAASSRASELICFHSKASFRNAALGIGLSLVSDRSGMLKEINCVLDYLSYDAFEKSGVRRSGWNEPFSHWMPLFIDAAHMARARHLLEESLSRVYDDRPFNPSMGVTVFTKIMCTFVVRMMKASEDGRPSLHTSVKALEGYCAFHRLLLYYLGEYPEELQKVNQQVDDFVDDPELRTKRHVPNLGELLSLLVVTRRSWDAPDVRMAFLLENFDRQVLWMCKDNPWLGHTDDTDDEKRLETTFQATRTSNRVLMFNVAFLTHVGRPAGASPAEIAEIYDQNLGRPSPAMQDALQKAAFGVMSVNTWEEFFRCIGVDMPDRPVLANMLRQAVRNSSAKGYHRGLPNVGAKRGRQDNDNRDVHRSRHSIGGGGLDRACTRNRAPPTPTSSYTEGSPMTGLGVMSPMPGTGVTSSSLSPSSRSQHTPSRNPSSSHVSVTGGTMSPIVMAGPASQSGGRPTGNAFTPSVSPIGSKQSPHGLNQLRPPNQYGGGAQVSTNSGVMPGMAGLLQRGPGMLQSCFAPGGIPQQSGMSFSGPGLGMMPLMAGQVGGVGPSQMGVPQLTNPFLQANLNMSSILQGQQFRGHWGHQGPG